MFLLYSVYNNAKLTREDNLLCTSELSPSAMSRTSKGTNIVTYIIIGTFMKCTRNSEEIN
jgi:hypothetical protein